MSDEKVSLASGEVKQIVAAILVLAESFNRFAVAKGTQTKNVVDDFEVILKDLKNLT
jgi:hypothetical protein